MTLDHWRRVSGVFDAVMAHTEGDRAQALAELCGGDENLRREVASLLAHARGASASLEPQAYTGVTLRGPVYVGRRFGPYVVQSLLGAGGMGEVYRAHDERLDRAVAIKVLPPLFSDDPERLSRFTREAKALAALNHPNVGAIYGHEDVDGSPALVLELVEGETLAERIAHGPLAVAEALAIARQIAQAVEAAHERGIVHRDLKPANVKITPQGVVKVLDFGLARLGADEAPSGAPAGSRSARPGTRHGALLGTIAYMSPEQASGATADKRSDLWAFGSVLLEMLTGRPVFTGRTDADLLTAVLTTEPDLTQLPRHTPTGIRTLLRRCLERDRSRRLDSAAAARLEIDDALAVTVPPVGRWRRWRAVVSAAAALVVIASAAGLSWLWQRDYFWQNPLVDAQVERVTDFDGEDGDAAISPDGEFAAFVSNRDGRFDAWVTRLGSDEFTNITRGRFQIFNNPTTRSAGFSGDGTETWFMQEVSARPWKWTSWISPFVASAPRVFIEDGLDPVWSPDGERVVYHTNALGDPIFIADRNGNGARQLFAAAPGLHCHYLAWSPDGRFVYFAMGTLPTEEMDIWRVPVSAAASAAAPERITFHNSRVAYLSFLDARTLIYSATASNGAGQWLYAIDVHHRIPHRVSAGVVEQYLSVSASRTRPRRIVATIAVPSASLWTVPIADAVQTEAAATRVQVANTRALGPRFATGALAFLSSKGGVDGLWTLENGTARELWRGDDGGVVAPPAPSPDGRLICFSYRRQGTAGLYVMNANGTNVRPLAAAFDVRGAASWSPDGRWIVVAANAGQGTRLFKIPVNGGEPVRLVDRLSFNPVWSPDGRVIVYSEQQNAGQFEVKAITPDRVPVPMVELQVVGFTNATPYRFLPDGQALVVLEGVRNASQDFFHVDLKTGARRQLTALARQFVIHDFDLSPDGSEIVFDRHRNHSDVVLMRLAR